MALKISKLMESIVVPLCIFGDSNDYQYYDSQLTTKELKIAKESCNLKLKLKACSLLQL